MTNASVNQRTRFDPVELRVPTAGTRVRNRRALIACTACALALWLCSLAVAAGAEAYVYWTNGSGGPAGIGRANLDGTGGDNFFITGAGGPSGIAVDAAHVYWADSGRIGRANLNGTGTGTLVIAGGTGSVAVDDEHVYWSRSDSIGRANLDGTGTDQTFIPLGGGLGPQSVAVDARHIYWTHPWGGIARAKLDGTRVEDFFIGARAGSVAVDAGHVYWTSGAAPGRIGRANLDGSGVEPAFITVPGTPSSVAVDAGHVYWANQWTSSIGRADLDGTNPVQGIVSASNPVGIAVDALPDPTPPDTTAPDNTAPQTKIAKGAPKRIPKREVKFRFTSSEPDSTFECKLDREAFKACGSPKKATRLDEGRHRFKVRAIDAAGNVDPTAAKDRFKVVQATTIEGSRR